VTNRKKTASRSKSQDLEQKNLFWKGGNEVGSCSLEVLEQVKGSSPLLCGHSCPHSNKVVPCCLA
jgi:hypothetical protein